MKKVFINKNGTIRMEAVYCTLAIITALLIVLIYYLTTLSKGTTYNGGISSKPTSETTTIEICKDCAFSFKQEEIRVKPGNKYLFKDLMDVKGVTLKNLKLTVDDPTLLKVETDSKGDVVLATLNKVGHGTVTASYQDKSITMSVIVSQTEYKSAKFKYDTYYVYKGEQKVLELLTDPDGARASNFTIGTSNANVGGLSPANDLLGTEVGESDLSLDFNGKISKAKLYVINNRLTIKVNENGEYKEYDEYKYVSSYDGVIELSVTIEDRNNMAYDNSNLKFEVENHGKMNLSLSYSDINIYENKSYIYKAQVSTLENNNSSDNYAYIIFTLSDGSKSRIKITR